MPKSQKGGRLRRASWPILLVKGLTSSRGHSVCRAYAGFARLIGIKFAGYTAGRGFNDVDPPLGNTG